MQTLVSSRWFALLGLAVLVAASTPSVPVIPQSFSADYIFGLTSFPTPLFSGRFVFDYASAGSYLSLNDNPSGAVPYSLMTSFISAPLGNSDLGLYQFLSEGRCWDLGKQKAGSVHSAPFAIPKHAMFSGNTTVNGDLCSVWSWDIEEFPVKLNATVRYSDSGILNFNVWVPMYSWAGISWTATSFSTKVDPKEFNAPPGPCAAAPPSSTAPLLHILSRLVPQSVPSAERRHFVSVIAKVFGFPLPKNDIVSNFAAISSSSPPPPPKLNQYFSADFQFGYGTLNVTNKFLPSDSYFTGHTAVDKKSGGFYISITDDQDANVPFRFLTSLIGHPSGPGYTDGYFYLTNGRCWKSANSFANPDWPLQVPSDAKFGGIQAVYGRKASLWLFTGQYNEFDANIEMAVDVTDSSIIFFNVLAGAEDYSGSLYFVFNNFNATRPDPSVFAPPSGPCPYIYA